MDEQEKQAYTNFVKNAWARAMNLAKGQQLDNADYVLLKMNDLANAGGGGNPTGTAGTTPSGAAANSANPDDTLLSRNPAPKSSH